MDEKDQTMEEAFEEWNHDWPPWDEEERRCAWEGGWRADDAYKQKRIKTLEVALKDMKNVAKTCAATLIVFGAIVVSTGVVRLILSVKHWLMR